MKFVTKLLWIGLFILLSIGFWKLFLFIDFDLISPLFLPEDLCYYHKHEVPFLIEFFYMNRGANGHPEGSLIHFLLLLISSIFTAYKVKQLIFKKTKL